MERKKADWKAKLLLITTSTLLVGVSFGLAELYCRYFTRIMFLDNSSGLFTPGRYGNTYGNTPNFEGISFGAKFYTDENGFRIDPSIGPIADSNGEDSILILGDSVSFGPGLPEEETVAAALRRALPGRIVFNASAIGYDTFDYLNAGRAVTAEKPGIKTVLLFFCLNDVSDASAQLIRSQTAPDTAQRPQVGETRSLPRVVNDYLRSRSKLYIWVKNQLYDTQLIYFRNDLSNYAAGEENVYKALQPVADLNSELRAKGIKLKLFILPYEAQLRPNAEAGTFRPQQLVSAFMQRNGVDRIDVTPKFQNSPIEPNRLFLYGDPMHLSREGMEVLAEGVCENIDGCDPKRLKVEGVIQK